MVTRPPELLYAVDERPPPVRLAMLGLQYAILIGIYLIFVVMVARAAKVPADVMQDLVGLGFIAAAIGTFVQAYRGSWFGSGYLAPPVFSAIYVGPSFSIWGRGILRLMSVMFGVTAGLLAAFATGVMDGAALAPIAASPWLSLPNPSFLSYSLEASLLPAFLAAGFAATLRTIGVVTTCQKINDTDWKRPDLANIKKGVLGDAIGSLCAGCSIASAPHRLRAWSACRARPAPPAGRSLARFRRARGVRSLSRQGSAQLEAPS